MFYGESQCEEVYKSVPKKGIQCTNKAYCELDAKYYCGVHCKNKEDRTELPKRKKDEKDKMQKELMENFNNDCKEYAKNNLTYGNIKLYRMLMLKSVPLVKNYINVFPNNKHGDRKDGIGLPNLSPMRLGPVVHGQKSLPDALNIENFHQFSKKFKGETIEDFKKAQMTGFLDPIPHRHKIIGDEKNKNIPEYFIWIDKNNMEQHLTYIQSRQFYCNFYQRLVENHEDYKMLVEKLKNGYNLQICGYDAHDMNYENVEECYLDDKRAFGHERVLAAMLFHSLGVIDELPWIKHKTFDF